MYTHMYIHVCVMYYVMTYRLYVLCILYIYIYTCICTYARCTFTGKHLDLPALVGGHLRMC